MQRAVLRLRSMFWWVEHRFFFFFFFFNQNLIFRLFFCVVLFLIFRVGLGLGDTAT